MQTLKNRRGQGLVEYILVVVLMGIFAIAFIQKLGKSTQTGFTSAANQMDQAFNP
jgi:Flp pilus assembly pilin Flp